MKRLSKLSAVLLPVILLGGCESIGLQDGGDVAVEDRGTAAEGADAEQSSAAQARGAQAGSSFQGHALDDPNSLLSQRVIYFDYDSTWQFYDNYVLDVEITHSMDELIIEVINDLNSMALSPEDRDHADEAIEKLIKIQTREINQKKDIEKNIKETLKAIEKILKIENTDVTNVGMKLVELLKIIEVKWNLQD